MTLPAAGAGAALPSLGSTAPAALSIPGYLEEAYWWAYVHPNAVQVFEREWLVNLILFNNYGQLRDEALADLGEQVGGATLQMACVYGNLTPRLQQRLAPGASLHVADVLPIQLHNLRAKLAPDPRVHLLHSDCRALPVPDASYDQVLLFFLLHEQPESVRRATLAEAMRLVRPGGKVVIVDYHRPHRWHPLKLLMTGVFRKLEPYAMDLWDNEIAAFMPAHARWKSVHKKTYFGGLYQKLVLVR